MTELRPGLKDTPRGQIPALVGMGSQLEDDAPSAMGVVVQACAHAAGPCPSALGYLATKPSPYPCGVFIVEGADNPTRHMHGDGPRCGVVPESGCRGDVLPGFQRFSVDGPRRLLELPLSFLPSANARARLVSRVVRHLRRVSRRVCRLGRFPLPRLNLSHQSHTRIVGACHA